jgi:hypothetical protein
MHEDNGYEVHINKIEDIIEKQKQIGWRYIIRGFVAEAWGAQQELYMRLNDKEIVGDSHTTGRAKQKRVRSIDTSPTIVRTRTRNIRTRSEYI